MTTQRVPQRLEELDSLRGVAAMVVVAFHFVKFWNPSHPMWWRAVLASPMSILLNGPDAVLLFFVLSGFVLYLPYLKTDQPFSYPGYLAKRVCRIYLPYLAALAISITADWYFYRPIGDITTDAMHWARPFPTAAILPHILFLGPAPIFDFNPVFWSLVHEMRISIVFPAIAMLARRLPLGAGLTSGFTVCGAGLMLLLTSHAEWATIGFAGLFLVGACMARNLEKIRDFASRVGPYGRGLGFVLAVGLLKSMHGFPERFKIFPVQAALHGPAVALIIALAVTTIHFKRLLHTRVLRWLGRVSYSLYLVHMTVLYTVVCLFWKRTEHHGWLLATGVGASLAVAAVFYRWVERPAMLLGRRLGGDRRRAAVAHGSASVIAQRPV